MRFGIRTTTVERALVDLGASEVDQQRLLKLMREARFRNRLDLKQLRRVADRRKHAGDSATVRRALHWHELGDGGTDSALERRLLRALLDAAIRRPRCNAAMRELGPRSRVDLVWDLERVIVEADGPHHLDVLVRAEDDRRDRRLRDAGWTVVRFWWWEIEEHPTDVVRRVRAALAASVFASV